MKKTNDIENEEAVLHLFENKENTLKCLSKGLVQVIFFDNFKDIYSNKNAFLIGVIL